VDYNTVDYYLYGNQAERDAYQYEAVFADSTSLPFHEGAYLIMSVESVPDLEDYQIDSILLDLSRTLETDIEFGPTADFIRQTESQAPNYDSLRQEISVLNDIVEAGRIVKKNLWVMRLFEHGVANYYFFSPDSLFGDNIPMFEDMLISFSTENLETASPIEPLKLAEVDVDEDDYGARETVVLITGAAIILIIVLARLRRRKKREPRS
jgi:hypothetical protein